MNQKHPDPSYEAYDPAEDHWNRARLALAYQFLASMYHSGGASIGYAKGCQADRILESLRWRPGLAYDASTDEEIRSIAAAVLWKHRRRIAARW